ncbi:MULTISPECIES: hypothetical protein [Segatella]|uniref:Uncharacterized protein n=2 Tax=Segatella TaxID=2974251 RepID=D8DZ38_9BACT|nr:MULTISPECIES: hypothetical protein [Segatella]EFI71280.1 conserved hypothetical protein [Segatella baroniae B14]UKK79240.1 hypothetical protein L6469_12815 [Segatella baroniae B14]GJG28442.1 hypothetical protein PRRU23_21420 [Segatella bryantii]SEQ52464.1 hypothetical protein SAMN05444375_11024 [Segatella baroniae B14]
MKKEYIKPSMKAIKLQHSTQLLAGSGNLRGLQSSGWEDLEDELDLSDQGGGSSIWDR